MAISDLRADPARDTQDLFTVARLLKTPVWVFDIDKGRIIHANAPACALWQAESEAELLARDLSSDMSPTVARRLRQYQSDFIAGDAAFNELWTLYPKGMPTNVMVHFRGLRLPDGRMAMQCEAFGKAEEQPESIRSLEALLHTDVMVGLYDISGARLYTNPAARSIAREGKTALTDLFFNRRDFDAFMQDLERVQELRQVVLGRVDGGERWFDISAKRCLDAVTGQPAVLITAIDVSELKNAKDQARYLADFDMLTGCFNRSYLQHYSLNRDNFGSKRLAFLYFDVDRFKQINDTFGHKMGDKVLIKLAERAKSLIGWEDTIIRLGGDEFVIVLPSDDTTERLKTRIQMMFNALSQPVQYGAVTVDTSISMGVVITEDAEWDVETALSQSDIALYTSKRLGRNQCTFFEEAMGYAIEQRCQTEIEIEKGLERREFLLHFQPRVDLKSGHVASIEGLARWQHPDRGLVMPAEFIPICEETGMIDALGRQVLEIGFDAVKQINHAGHGTAISINVSPRQFYDDGFLNGLKACAAAPGFVPGQIELEITESVLVGDPQDIAAKLEEITEMGFEIAIDDFGTRYSNLSYISHFPLHSLKIDQSFTSQLPQSAPIIKLILSLAKQIGARTVAEGVETKEQYAWLARHGCDQAQGYYIARPTPLDRLDLSSSGEDGL